MQNERMKKKEKNNSQSKQREKKKRIDEPDFILISWVYWIGNAFFFVLIRQRVAANFVYLTVQWFSSRKKNSIT